MGSTHPGLADNPPSLNSKAPYQETGRDPQQKAIDSFVFGKPKPFSLATGPRGAAVDINPQTLYPASRHPMSFMDRRLTFSGTPNSATGIPEELPTSYQTPTDEGVDENAGTQDEMEEDELEDDVDLVERGSQSSKCSQDDEESSTRLAEGHDETMDERGEPIAVNDDGAEDFGGHESSSEQDLEEEEDQEISTGTSPRSQEPFQSPNVSGQEHESTQILSQGSALDAAQTFSRLVTSFTARTQTPSAPTFPFFPGFTPPTPTNARPFFSPSGPPTSNDTLSKAPDRQRFMPTRNAISDHIGKSASHSVGSPLFGKSGLKLDSGTSLSKMGQTDLKVSPKCADISDGLKSDICTFLSSTRLSKRKVVARLLRTCQTWSHRIRTLKVRYDESEMLSFSTT